MVTSSLIGMEPVVDDLERQAVAAAIIESNATLLEVEARQFALAAQWADLHPMSSGTVLPGTERARRYGGDGTPRCGSGRPGTSPPAPAPPACR